MCVRVRPRGRVVSDRRPYDEARLPAEVEDTPTADLAYLVYGKFKTEAENDPGFWDTRWVPLEDLLEADGLDKDDVEEALDAFEAMTTRARESLVAVAE